MQFAPGAYRWAGVPMLVGGVAGLVYPPLALFGFLLGIGALLFFRDPDRSPPPDGILAPADGRVSVVREEEGRVRLGVFMGPWNVHVNRAPIGGEIQAVDHEPGGHWPAFSKSSEHNERLTVTFEDHEVVLITGAFARRITPYVEDGDRTSRGQRIGHIAFGSRVDTLLPPEIDLDDIAVSKGQRVKAGETVIVSDEE